MSKENREARHDGDMEKDLRVEVTRKIWFYSVAMMGISIPLTATTHSSLIPFCVLAATTVSTATVWLSKGIGSFGKPSLPASGVTQEQFEALQARLESVETTSSFERSLQERKMSEVVPVERTTERATSMRETA